MQAESTANPVFVQAFKQLHHIEPSHLRNKDRGWRVEFIGEGASDAGGPYRESVSHICSELSKTSTLNTAIIAPTTTSTTSNIDPNNNNTTTSDPNNNNNNNNSSMNNTSNSSSGVPGLAIPLLIPCPNAREGTGQNIDQQIPNPSATDAQSIQYFQFLGKLMGVAIRTGDPLSLNLSSFFWKQMIGHPLESKDLFNIDVRVGELLKGLIRGELISRNQEDNNEEEGHREEINITFTTKLSDGSEVELIPNGKKIRVDADNVEEYVRLVEERRLRECERQVAAIRKGLATVVPIKVIHFSFLVPLNISVL